MVSFGNGTGVVPILETSGTPGEIFPAPFLIKESSRHCNLHFLFFHLFQVSGLIACDSVWLGHVHLTEVIKLRP